MGDTYRFGDEGRHSSYRSRPSNEEFWRNKNSHPAFDPSRRPPQPQSYRPRHDNSHQRNARRPPRRNGRVEGPQGNNRQRGPDRPKRSRIANRPLLQRQADTGPGHLMGGDANQPRFKALEDLSDDESVDGPIDQLVGDSAGDTDGPPRKKVAFGFNHAATEAPKWSNPDPYTALPPPGGMHNAGKKAIDLIRKARMSNTREDMLADNSDFISFDEPKPPPDAPTGPRAMHPLPAKPRFAQSADPGPPPRLPHDLQDSLKAPGLSSGSNRRGSSDTVPRYQALNAGERSTAGTHRLDPGSNAGASQQSDKSARRKRKREEPPDPLNRAAPWADHSLVQNKDLEPRLHEEILQFYNYIQPREFEHSIRAGIIQRLQQNLDAISDLPTCTVHSFGSYPAGIYLPKADMDLVAISDRCQTTGEKAIGQNSRRLQRITNKLRQSKIVRKNSIILIAKAKVPIIKYVDDVTGINVDVSFENFTGITANETYTRWKAEHPAMPIIVTLIKQLLTMQGLNEVHTGGIGGFTISCLVVSFFQLWPLCKDGEVIPLNDLGKTLMYFLDFYGTKFEYRALGIQFNPPRYFQKQQDVRYFSKKSRGERLFIVDPNNEDNDISGGSSKVAAVFSAFREARETLTQRHKRLCDGTGPQPEKGLLGSVLGWSYQQYESQREHMYSLANPQGPKNGNRVTR